MSGLLAVTPKQDAASSRWRRIVEVAFAGEALLYLVTGALTTVVTVVALQLWNAARAVPFYYSGDALAVGAHIKTVLETGWYERQPALAAPFGQTYHEFPQADNLHMAVVAVMNTVVDSWAVAMNLYYLLGFPLAALTALWFFRLVGISRALAVSLAVLFAVAPFHFARNQSHLFLGSYFPLPLGAGVVVLALRGSSLWGRRAGPRTAITGHLTGRSAGTVVALILLGSASSYYSIFTLMLLGVAGPVALWRDRSWTRFAGAVGAGGVLVTTMIANMAPDILYARGRPANTAILRRNPEGAEVYALKLAQLLLPSQDHRWSTFSGLRRTYDEKFPVPSEMPSLGMVAAAGLVAVMVIALASLAGWRSAGERARQLSDLALLTTVALAFSHIGGLSTLIALLATDKVRGWNRMSIVIGLFSLAVVGALVDGGLRWVRGRTAVSDGVATAVSAVAVIGILAVGLVDQTSDARVPEYQAVEEVYARDRAYVAGIEQALPAGSAVFQLPFHAFPETPPVNGVGDTDQLRLYLSSSRTRWSAGGLKGRPQTDWPAALAGRPMSQVVPLLAIAGFSGISVDHQELGSTAARIDAELIAELGGGPSVVTADGRFVFWPLAGVTDRLAIRYSRRELDELRAATVLPPGLSMDVGFDDPVPRSGRTLWRGRKRAPQMLLDNARRTPLPAHLSFVVTSPTGTPEVVVQLPGREALRVDLRGGPATVDVDVVLPPGRSEVRLRTPHSDDPASFDVLDVRLTDPVLEAFRP